MDARRGCVERAMEDTSHPLLVVHSSFTLSHNLHRLRRPCCCHPGSSDTACTLLNKVLRTDHCSEGASTSPDSTPEFTVRRTEGQRSHIFRPRRSRRPRQRSSSSCERRGCILSQSLVAQRILPFTAAAHLPLTRYHSVTHAYAPRTLLLHLFL